MHLVECKGDVSMVRQRIGPTTHLSENTLVRRPIGPKTHWSEEPLVQKSVIGPKIIGPKKCIIGPTAHWSENVPLVQKPSANCVAVIIYWYCFV